MTSGSNSTLHHWQRRLLVLLATLGMVASQTIGVALAGPNEVDGNEVTVKWYGLASDGVTRKTSLEPSDGYACGDVVHFEAEVELDAGAPAGTHVLRMAFEFAQEPTGGQGVGFRDFDSVTGATWVSDTWPTTTDANGKLTQDGEVVVDLTISPGETTSVFLDVRLGCSAPFKLSGNVHTGLGDIVADPGSANEKTFGAGNQTVPLTTSVSQTQLTITKDASGAGPTDLFSFTFGPVGGVTEGFGLFDGDSWDTPVYPGTYRVLETALPTGWSLDDVTCTGATPTDVTGGIDVTVPFDADVSCTFKNIVTPAPALTVLKEIWDGDSWEDADTAPGVSFSLGDTVDYRIVATNTGNVALSGVTLSDSLHTLKDGIGSATNCTVPTTLAVGASITCYARTTATVGTTTNTATADSTETAPATDDAVYTVTSGPALTVVKEISDDGGTTWQDADTAPGVSFSLGDTVDYRIVATNTGNVALSGVTLSDSLHTLKDGIGSATNCTVPTTLAVGASITCYARTTATVGTTTNTATADSTETAPATDDAVYSVGANASVDVVKYVWNPDSGTYVDADNKGNAPTYAVGDTVKYKITVENTGNVPLTGFTLSDDDLPTLTGTDGGATACDVPSTLPVGATVHDCYGTTTAVYNLGNDGDTKNTATGSGTYIDKTVSDDDHAWYRVLAADDVSVEKQVTVKSLSPNEEPVPPSEEATWSPADTPAAGPTATIGTHEVWFKAIVTNTGNRPMTPTHVYDELVGTDGLPLQVSASTLFADCQLPATLAAGDSYECIDGPVIPTSAGTFGNLVTAEFVDPSGGTLTSLSNNTRVAFGHVAGTTLFPKGPVVLGHPAFAFFKAVTPTVIIPPGGPDPASLTIQKQTLPDGDTTAFTFTPSTNLSTSTFDLSDGQSRTFSGLAAGTYTVTETAEGGGWSLTDISCGTATASRVGSRISLTLTAGQTATCVFTNTLTEVAPVVIEDTNPSLSVTKTALLEPDADGGKSVVYTPGAGTVIEYEYTITNTGDVTITDITAVDDILGELFPATTTLAPGESTTATATHLLTSADADAEAVVNTVTVTGLDPDGTEITATDTESVSVIEVLPSVIERPEPAPEPQPAPEPVLPRTGTDSAGLFALSLLLVSIGLATLGLQPTRSAGRRR